MRLQFLGCGDAFGSGGRFNTCMFIETKQTKLLLDCGASSLVAMKRFGVRPNEIDTILVTHLYADHFGGLPFLILDAQFLSKRLNRLTVAGPRGIEDKLYRAMELAFPGSSKTAQAFDLQVLELESRQPSRINHLVATPYQVYHDGEAPFFAYRIEADDRVIAYSGDTEWCDVLTEAAKGADLFVCEAYFYDKAVKFHLDLKTLEKHLPAINPKRLVLTHMSEDMLKRINDLPYEFAEDGKVISL